VENAVSWLENRLLQNMDSLPTVLLKPGEGDRVVCRTSLDLPGFNPEITSPVTDGAVGPSEGSSQRFVGIGFFNSRSKINVRLIATERVAVDATFFENRIRSALAVRTRHLPNATSFRVVNAESDFLSGLICDKYEDLLVVQTSSLGMDQRKSEIAAALQKVFQPRAILERNDISSRKFEGLQRIQFGPFWQHGRRLEVHLNGLSFPLDPVGGHKMASTWTSRSITNWSATWRKMPRSSIASAFWAGSPFTPPGRALPTSTDWIKASRPFRPLQGMPNETT